MEMKCFALTILKYTQFYERNEQMNLVFAFPIWCSVCAFFSSFTSHTLNVGTYIIFQLERKRSSARVFFCIYFFSAILPFVYFAAFSQYSLISFSIWYVPIRYDNNLHIFTVFLLFLLQSSNVMAFFCLFIYFRKQLNGITSTNAQPTRAHTHTQYKNIDSKISITFGVLCAE